NSRDAPLQDLQGDITAGPAPDLLLSPWQPLARALREWLHGSHSRSWPVRLFMRPLIASIERSMPPELDIISLLEDYKTDALVIVPHDVNESSGVDYYRTARRTGIPTVCLPIRWDDLEQHQSLLYELPDVIAVWNEEERRLVAHEFRIPTERIAITGALLASDVIDDKPVMDRGAYCERMGIDPSQPLILFQAPAVSTRADVERFREWRR